MRRTKNCRKMYKTHTMGKRKKEKKKGFRPYDHQPRKNLHTAISVNKPKLSRTKCDQTLTQINTSGLLYPFLRQFPYLFSCFFCLVILLFLSCLFFLLLLIIHSCAFFFSFSRKHYLLRVRLFCMVLVEQLGDDSWEMVFTACCHMALVFAIVQLY